MCQLKPRGSFLSVALRERTSNSHGDFVLSLKALSEHLSLEVSFGSDFLPGKKVLATPSAGQSGENPYSALSLQVLSGSVFT